MSLPVMTIEGDVVAVHSHWTNDGSRIVTEATIRPPEGEDVVVRQLGGSVDGVAMIAMPGPVILELGMTVALAVHRDLDLSQHEHVVVDSVKVSAYPPDYVRTLTKTGRPFYWESGCVFVTVDAAGTAALPDDQVGSRPAATGRQQRKPGAGVRFGAPRRPYRRHHDVPLSGLRGDQERDAGAGRHPGRL